MKIKGERANRLMLRITGVLILLGIIAIAWVWRHEDTYLFMRFLFISGMGLVCGLFFYTNREKRLVKRGENAAILRYNDDSEKGTVGYDAELYVSGKYEVNTFVSGTVGLVMKSIELYFRGMKYRLIRQA